MTESSSRRSAATPIPPGSATISTAMAKPTPAIPTTIRGRLWPIFDAERGNYQIAATGTGGAGSPYLAALKAFSTPQGFIPEQIWNPSVSLPGDTDNPSGWAVATPAGDTPGAITGSMEPLNWAQGEYITLLAD